MLITCPLLNRGYQMVRFFVICLIAVVLTMGIVPVVASKTPDPVKTNIIVGGEIGYPPYSFLDEKGKPTGFQIELTQAIAKTMGINVEIRLRPWPETRKALEDGTIDIIPGMFYSEERAKIYDFSPPFAIVSTAIFARKNSPSVKSTEDLRNKEIIVMRGEAMHDYILKHSLTNRILLTETPADALRMLAAGKGDYALVAQMPGFYWIKELKLSNIMSAGPSLEPFKNCFAVRKGNKLLLSRFIEGLSIINQTGEYSKLYEKWLGVLEPTGITFGLAVKYTAIVLIPLILLLAVSLLWTLMLRSKVNQKTSALRESEERYRNLFENAHEAIFVAQDGNLVFLNSRTTTQIGYSVEELKSKSFIEFIHPDDREMVIENHIKRMKGEEIPNIYSFRIIHRDGSVRWTELNAVSINWDGKPATLNFMTDITEHKQAEDALRKSETRYQMLFNSSLDAIAVMGGTPPKVLFANPAFLRLFGYASEEILAFSADDIFLLVHPEDREIVKSRLHNRFRQQDSPNKYEFRIVTKDGQVRWVEVSASSVLIGNKLFSQAIYHDITERKRVLESLQKSEANYKQLFDNSPVAIYQINFRTGKFIKANDVLCRYLGCSQEEITSLSPYDSLANDSKKLFSERLEKMSLGEKVTENPEYEVVDKNGKRSWLQLNSKNIYDSEGLAGADVVAHDITERKQTEKQLQDTLESLRKAVGTTIQVMVSAIEVRDPYTAGHQIRSAGLARAIATEMGLLQEKIEGIRVAASIHDIGKLSLPSEILSKPTKLSEIEFSLIKEHAQKGYEILKNVESPWPLAEIVYQHHERMDGSGYPRNLKGNDILIEARILIVADVVEAMSSHRPYRPSLGIDAALEEIEKNRGTFYDEAVVVACLRLFREKGYQLDVT